MLKRVAGVLAVVLGIVGVVACEVGAYVVYQTEARLQHANDRAFALLDRGLGYVEARTRRVAQRVHDAKITTDEIKQKLKDWTKLEAKERVATRLEIDKRTETLAGHLQTADTWLESSTESVRDAQHLLEVGQSLGTRLDPAALEEVLGHITSARGRVQEAEEVVDRIHGYAIDKDGIPDQSRLEFFLAWVARILATVTEADAFLARCAQRLAERRADAQETKARVSQRIRWGAIIGYVILAWVALGQLALCWCGVRGCCRSRSPATPPVA